MKNIAIYDKTYNALRDNALKRIEKKEKIPDNLELNFLGLTTYLAEDNLDSSLFDKIINIQNGERRVEHIRDKNVYFMPLQVEALNYLNSHNRAMILAPTSFGKTMIVKEYIFKKQFNSIAYIVPTNALSYELETSFKENDSFSRYDIFSKTSKSKEDLANKIPFFIGTQEKFFEVKDIIGNIDLIVIDEAYKLEDSPSQQRGFILSKTFLDSIKNSTRQIILLCPNAKISGFDKYDFSDPFVTTFNAVSKDFTRLNDRDALFKELNKIDKENKTILYCENPKDIYDAFDNIEPINNGLNQSEFLNDIIADFHEEWSVAKYLSKGILVHHGQMPKYIQNKMISLFNKNDSAKLLVGTNSISEGINTPTKNVVIDSKVNVSKKLMLIKNTIGRAGRLGEMPVGHIFSTEDLESKYKEDPSIVLSIKDQENLDIIEDSSNQDKIGVVADEYNLDSVLIKTILKEQQMSLDILIKIVKKLKNNIDFVSFSNIVGIAHGCFKPDFYPLETSLYLRGLFQHSYVNSKGEKVVIKSYRDRVNFYRQKYKGKENKTDSEIIDGYMKFMYATLDYCLLPVSLVAKRIAEKYPQWQFGTCVYESLVEFNKQYYRIIFNEPDFEKLDDDTKSIISAFREYGINLADQLISVGLYKEIEVRLSKRYSMYDIIKTMRAISIDETSKYKSICRYLLNKYID